MVKLMAFLAFVLTIGTADASKYTEDNSEGGYRSPDYYPHRWYLYDFHGGSFADAPYKGRDADRAYGDYNFISYPFNDPDYCDCCH